MISHILRRKFLLKHVTEGNTKEGIEVKGRQRRIRKQLLDDLKETRGYWKLQEAALDRAVWRTDFGAIVRQTAE